jgi:hypothetical protein
MEGEAQWFASCEDVCDNLTPLSNSNNGERTGNYAGCWRNIAISLIDPSCE